MNYSYDLQVDSFGTEYADVAIFDNNGDFKAAFIVIPAEDGMTEDYVKNNLEELAERYKPIPYISPDERLDKIEPIVTALAQEISKLDGISLKTKNLLKDFL